MDQDINYTKISLRRDLHSVIKKISDGTGIKMYHIADKAIIEFIEKYYPKMQSEIKE